MTTRELIVSKLWKKPRFVLLLYNGEEVARFRSFTSEDCYGGRKFSDSVIDIEAASKLRDIIYEQRARALRALYVEYNLDAGPNAPGKIIEDFGYQWLTTVSHSLNKYKPGFETTVFVTKGPKPHVDSRHSAIQRLRQLRARQLF